MRRKGDERLDVESSKGRGLAVGIYKRRTTMRTRKAQAMIGLGRRMEPAGKAGGSRK